MAILTNIPYAEALEIWREHTRSGALCSGRGGSAARFCIGADRVRGFRPSDDEGAVAHALATLHAMRGEQFTEHSSQWSIVFDPRNLRTYFRTKAHPALKYVDLADLEQTCGPPVQMLDIQQPLPGDASGALFDFDFDLALEHYIGFCRAWGVDLPDQTLERQMRRLAGFPCQAAP